MNAWSADHVADVRDLKDRKVDIESQISKEREREGEMLASKSRPFVVSLADRKHWRKRGIRCRN